jgi:ADP-heptose:LPS heptosyltransferase
LITELDLVISVCTSIAHLSGALGRPTWTMLACAADWRWLQGRADSPWYPTMRLFRQPHPRDWNAVARSIAFELRALVSALTDTDR